MWESCGALDGTVPVQSVGGSPGCLGLSTLPGQEGCAGRREVSWRSLEALTRAHSRKPLTFKAVLGAVSFARPAACPHQALTPAPQDRH